MKKWIIAALIAAGLSAAAVYLGYMWFMADCCLYEDEVTENVAYNEYTPDSYRPSPEATHSAHP